ncbi:MAG: HlyD family type I secretion periplasmic adaptor subunit [Alphaproteobacteria bacterium]
MSRLELLAESYPLPTWRIVAWPVILFLAVLLGWTRYARLDEVAVAEGEVIPEGQVKVIQHLEGGIIREIYVTEGTTVKSGDSLLQLELSTTALHGDEIQIRLDGLTLQRARLEAEVNGRDLVFPEEEAKRQPQIEETERRAYVARRLQHENALMVLQSQADQKQAEIGELEAKRQTYAANLQQIKQKLQMSSDLLKEGLTPKMEHLQIETDKTKLEGEIATLDQSIPKARAALSEARARTEDARLSRRRETQEQLAQVEVSITSARETLNQATNQQARTQIHSPIDGVVKNMRYHTIGGVVQAGESIMEIVPTGHNVVVDAKLNPVDRGYVAAGQPAEVKISTYDYARYGSLSGKVTMVAPDSTTTQDGKQYFKVLITTEKTWMGRKMGELPVTPGMQATVDIHTGSKSVLDYLLTPVLKLKHESFRER